MGTVVKHVKPLKWFRPWMGILLGSVWKWPARPSEVRVWEEADSSEDYVEGEGFALIKWDTRTLPGGMAGLLLLMPVFTFSHLFTATV